MEKLFTFKILPSCETQKYSQMYLPFVITYHDILNEYLLLDIPYQIPLNMDKLMEHNYSISFKGSKI